MNDIKSIVVKIKHTFFQQRCNQEYHQCFKSYDNYLLYDNGGPRELRVNDRYISTRLYFSIRNFKLNIQSGKLPKNY